MMRKIMMIAIVMGLMLGLTAVPVKAATPEEIEASIEDGITWLVSQQNPDGSWADWNPGGETGFALVKLQERAFELGYDSPFADDYPYRNAVENGLNYLFSIARITLVYPESSGDDNPDGDGDRVGVYVTTDDWHRTYETGIALMAIASSQAPNRIVNFPGSPVNGWTYKQVMDDMVDYMAFGQFDASLEAPYQGGWGYTDDEQQRLDGDWRWSDNSNTGYAVLGLAYAQSPAYGFNCTVPQFVKDELNIWIDYIQNDVDGDPQDGGSGYGSPDEWVNVLKTGNLIFEMAFFGDGLGVPRVQDALDYLGRTWNDPSQDPGWGNPVSGSTPHYQAMYCIMKGLEYRGIDTIDVGGVSRDWYADFADAIVNTQQTNGSWTGDYWGGALLATEWALLTLEKSAPPVAEIYGQCIMAGESFEAVDLDETIDPENSGTPPYTWTVAGNVDLTVTIDVENVMTVTYPEGWIGSETLTITCIDAASRTTVSYPTFTVCAQPTVLDIPDQTIPFEEFDLDNYLSGIDTDDVEWSVSGVPTGWSVLINVENVVTVTAPENATEPATLSFTATSIVCPCAEPSGSDDVTFTFNQPPNCFDAVASETCLWSPNHKFVDITVEGVTDPDGDVVEITITSITSDEATASDKGSGGAKHAPDASGIGTDMASVRAERSGKADGRVYVIHFTASDGNGGECEGKVTVNVPHDQSSEGCPAIDSGQYHDATGLN